jgi:enhancer of polycomb-like protein
MARTKERDRHWEDGVEVSRWHATPMFLLTVL